MWDSPIGLKTVHFWYAPLVHPPLPSPPCMPACNAMLTRYTAVGLP
jgi:hypothetical protein